MVSSDRLRLASGTARAIRQPGGQLRLALVATWIAAGCITVNINFPAAEIEDAADRIIDEVRPGDVETATPPDADPGREEEVESTDPGDGASALVAAGGAFVAFPASPALARRTPVSGEDEEDDPVVRKIMESLKGRFPRLLPFYDKGYLGENRKGLVEMREKEKIPLRERKQLEDLIEAEKKDRMNMYRRIAILKGVDPSRLEDIQKIFAKRWIAKARKGWWIEKEEGKWLRKPTGPEKE